MTKDAGFKQRVRARMARTGERYAAARQHLHRTSSSATLHVTNGESAAMGLRAAGLDGGVLAWGDVLHDGPVPAGLDVAQLRRVRAGHLARAGFGQAAMLSKSFAARDRLLERHRQAAYVLWFEADLYDQLQLIQVLQRLAAWTVEPGRISLVSIGEYPGRAHFGGLGELEPEALAGLRPSGVAVDGDALALASAAWQAFTAPAPAALPMLARRQSPVLRYVGEAIARLMQEYPSRTDGLGLSERRILLAVQDGAETAGEVFRQVWRRERRPYLGDSACYASVRRLAAAQHPLLRVDDDGRGARARLQLTDVGRDVLAGEVDHARLNGLDRWLGGTHLLGPHPAYRYDERLETLIQT